MKLVISSLLTLASVLLSFKHGWDSLHYKANPESPNMLASLGISASLAPFLGAFTLAIGLLLLFPKTFFMGNLLNAVSIVVIMALALRANNGRIALLEIPFLLLPLLLIYLGYPLKKY